MHIFNKRFSCELTAEEIKHIENCEQCAFNRQKLLVLKASANQLVPEAPPEAVWQNLNSMVELQQKRRLNTTKLTVAIAASCSFLFLGWLSWSNYSTQSQLQDVLIANQLLEMRLKHNPVYMESSLKQAISEVEFSLFNSDNKEEQIKLLKQRQSLLEQVISSQKEQEYEFEI